MYLVAYAFRQFGKELEAGISIQFAVLARKLQAAQEVHQPLTGPGLTCQAQPCPPKQAGTGMRSKHKVVIHRLEPVRQR